MMEELVCFILENSVFMFRSDVFRQIQMTSSGTPAAVVIANAVMSALLGEFFIFRPDWLVFSRC